MSGKKIIGGLMQAVAHDNAISAVYRVLEGHPKFALTQMNDHIANEIVVAVKAALSQNVTSETSVLLQSTNRDDE